MYIQKACGYVLPYSKLSPVSKSLPALPGAVSYTHLDVYKRQHVELATASKLFCGCAASFGGEPNTRCCPVCLGLPGALPRLNRRAVGYAVRTGLCLLYTSPAGADG